MKHYPFDFEKKLPYLTSSLNERTTLDTVAAIRNGTFDGADAFLIHLEKLDPEVQNEKALRYIYAYAEDKPVLSVNYRTDRVSDDQALAELQLTSVRAGASCVDMMGDYFAPNADQITFDSDALARQRAFIDEIHALGGQIMMSAHFLFKPTEALIEQGLQMEEHGADIVKLAMRVDTEEQMEECVGATLKLKHAMTKPFLFVCRGKYGKAHRALAPLLGSCMVLCTQQCTANVTKEKPVLRCTKAVYDNLDYKPYGEGLSENDF